MKYYSVSIKCSNHEFEKINLVTKSGKDGCYDVVKCKNCGIEGRKYNFEYVRFPISFDEKKVNDCLNAPEIKKVKRIKVINCFAQGRQFGNLIPGSLHDVISPPKDQKIDNRGVWVMGIGEPVKVLMEEYIEIEVEEEIKVEAKKIGKKIKSVGDMHSNGKWVWMEYKPGKFDWRNAPKKY